MFSNGEERGWSHLYYQWLRSYGEEKLAVEEEMRQNWRLAWEIGSVEERSEILTFLGLAGVREGQEQIWRSLESDNEDIRFFALEACLMSFSKGLWPIGDREVNAVWSYFWNSANDRRMLALILLEQIGELTATKLTEIARTDPAEKIREEARAILRRRGFSESSE